MRNMQFDDLDVVVLNALKLFQEKGLPKLELPKFKRPLVVGSGNAAVTGRILFEKSDAVFADESTFKNRLDSILDIDGAFLLSASGGKHSPMIARELNKRGIRVILLTNNPEALAAKDVDETFVFPKQPEPYTYNTSTYLSMIMSHTQEDPANLSEFIKNELDNRIPDNFTDYDAFFIIIDNNFSNAREMFLTKFDELFGPIISGRVFTEDQTQHAKTLVQSDKELFIGLGHNNEIWGTKRLNINIPNNADYGSVIAIGYYIIGMIQKQNKPYFKQNVSEYTKQVSELFSQDIKPIVY